MRNREISQYDVIRQLRLPLIVLVTYAHSYGQVAEGYSLLGSGWDMYEVLKLMVSQTLVKVVVPVFFFMSGYLFFSNVKAWNLQTYGQKMKRRGKSLLIPYLVWNLLMAIKLKSLSIATFIEPANMPLWFLRDLMIVSLLTPIIYWSIKKLGWWLFVLLLPVYLTGIWAIQPAPNPYGLCFFTFGAFMSIRKMDILKTFAKVEWPSYGLFVVLAFAMVLTYHTSLFPLLMLCFRIVSIPAVFCLAQRTTLQRPSPLCNSAYFIYLSHYVLFFSAIDAAFFALFGTSTVSLSLHYLLVPLLKAGILIAIYGIYHKIKQMVTT